MATWVRDTRSVFEQGRRKRQVDMEAYARENILWLDRYLNDAISILEAYVGRGSGRAGREDAGIRGRTECSGTNPQRLTRHRGFLVGFLF